MRLSRVEIRKDHRRGKTILFRWIIPSAHYQLLPQDQY